MNVEEFSPDATVWIFGITPPLDANLSETVASRVRQFLSRWSAHGASIPAGAAVVDGTFLLIAADSEATSGCSIDEMYGFMRQLEGELRISLLDPNRVFYRRGDGSVAAAARTEFAECGTLDTMVFDTTVQRLGEVTSGAWEKRAADSWHVRLLRRVAAR